MQKNLFKSIVSTFFTRFFIAVSNLGIAILLSNYIGAAGKGDQSLIITLITFIIVFTSIIGAASISYLIPRFPFLSLIVPSYLWIFIVTVAGYFVLPWLNLVAPAYNSHVCFLSFFLAILNVNISVLISKQRINAANLLGFLQSFLIIVLLVIAFIGFRNRSLQSYILALYGGYGITLIVSFMMIRSYFIEAPVDSFSVWLSAFKKLALLGFYNQVAVFTQLLSFRLSYYILNASTGREAVGIYSNAVSIAESIWLIGRSIATVQHSKIVNSTDKLFSLRLTSRMNTMNMLISILLLLILISVPDSLYTWIFGKEFVHINRIIWTLAPGIVFFGIALVLGYYFSSTGRHIVNAIASTVGLIVTLALGFILIPLYHSYGAGIVASVSYGATALVVIFFFIREKKKTAI
jgi:O-antigen/teichoic acid export membrane protein